MHLWCSSSKIQLCFDNKILHVINILSLTQIILGVSALQMSLLHMLA